MEDRRGQNDKVSRRMWKAVETGVREVGMGEAEGRRNKGKSREKEKEKTEKGENSGS